MYCQHCNIIWHPRYAWRLSMLWFLGCKVFFHMDMHIAIFSSTFPFAYITTNYIKACHGHDTHLCLKSDSVVICKYTFEVQLSHLTQWSLALATYLLQNVQRRYPSAAGNSIPGAGKLVNILTGDGFDALGCLEKCLWLSYVTWTGSLRHVLIRTTSSFPKEKLEIMNNIESK